MARQPCAIAKGKTWLWLVNMKSFLNCIRRSKSAAKEVAKFAIIFKVVSNGLANVSWGSLHFVAELSGGEYPRVPWGTSPWELLAHPALKFAVNNVCCIDGASIGVPVPGERLQKVVLNTMSSRTMKNKVPMPQLLPKCQRHLEGGMS